MASKRDRAFRAMMACEPLHEMMMDSVREWTLFCVAMGEPVRAWAQALEHAHESAIFPPKEAYGHASR